SPNRRVWCAAASRPTLTTSDLPSPARSAARSAMSSRSPSAAGIIARCIAHATSARGGGRPALTRSRLPAGSGGTRAEWDSGTPDEQRHLGRMQLPHLLIPRRTKSTPPQRRKKNPACRMFPASRTGAARRSRITNDDVETYRSRRGACLGPFRYRSAEQTSPITRRRAWRDGLADQTVLETLEDVRSYRAFERVLI